MQLKKASPINFEKKDCDPVECPNCHQNNWRISMVTRKVTQLEHLHFTCVFCDLTFCPEVAVSVQSSREAFAEMLTGGDSR